MSSEKHDELFFRVLLGEESPDILESVLKSDPEARAEWEELQTMWSDLAVVLDRPTHDLPTLSRAPRRAWLPIALAACLAGFWLGNWYGGSSTSDDSVRSEESRFVLLLYAGDSEHAPDSDPAFIEGVIEEQNNWGELLQAQGRYILAEKLDTIPGVDLRNVAGSIEQHGESGGAQLRLGGLYVIHAKDLEEATRIARGCPLLKYGGIVRVRAIEDV